jgi:hypothetical protein
MTKLFLSKIYVPCWLAQIPESELSSNAKVVYAKVNERRHDKNAYHDSLKESSKILKISNEEFEKGIDELLSVKLIKKYHENGKMIYYKFLHHDWMDKTINPHYNYETFHYVKGD